jgi:hypothetical protein
MTKSVTYVEVDVPLFDGDRFAGLDGTQWLTRGAGLTGVADSKQLTVSVWVYRSSASANGARILSASQVVGTAPSPAINRIVGSNPANLFSINMNNSADTEILNVSTGVAIPADTWTHYMASFDLSDPAKCHLYQDDVSTLVTTTFTNDTIDFTRQEWSIAGYPDGTFKLTGGLGDLWFAPGVYIDLSIETNRRKFITAEGLPARLGATGSTPTGTAPRIYMSGAFDSWTNKGTGGAFTVTDSFSPIQAALTPAPDFLQTFRFAKPADYLDNKIYAFPAISDVSFTPALLSLGETLGQRAKLNISLVDFLHSFKGEAYDQGTFWGKWRGRYGTKLRGRALRLIQGASDQDLASMDTYHYLVENTDGPTPQAIYTFGAQDVLKLADDDRSQAPAISNGSLQGAINAAVTAATLSPVGIGNLEYPSSGWICLGGKEVVSFTRVGDALTMTRGQFGSVAVAHDAAERAQLVLRYAGVDVANIIYDLMVNYAAIPASYITLAEWQAETAANLNVIYAATLTEGTSVKKLVSELINQAALTIWWDDRAQKIRLQVLREISTDTDTFTEDRILAGSMNVKEQPDKRISQIWTYYGQRDPTDGGAKEDGFRAGLATVDLETEGEYGTPMVTKIQARWIETLSAAERLGQIQISRFRDPPRNFTFAVAPTEDISLAAGYQLEWWANQDEDGNRIPALIQITKVKRLPDRVEIEAEEMLASGVIVLTHTVILTTTGSLLSWMVPATWNNANNSVVAIGAGGGGADGGASGGNGGAGGGFSRVTNITLTPGNLISYRVGAGGPGGTPGTDGGDTWFNGASLAASTVGAKGGTGGSGSTGGGIGGAAGSGIGTTKTSGGNGGNGATNGDQRGGGGGGGAGGPNSNGAKGGGDTSNSHGGGAGGGGADGGSDGSITSGGVGGNGGNNRNGFGGGTTSSPVGDEGGGGAGSSKSSSAVEGGAGGAGEQLYTQTEAPIISAGPGGGGGGGGNVRAGYPGGLYGGGGGGGGAFGSGASGAQGVIAITWREA